MRIKLCRIFNLFNKPTIIYSSLLLIAVLILSIVYKNFYYLFIIPVFSIFYCYNYSSFLIIENQSITYKDFQVLGNRGKGKDYKYIYSKVTIEVESVKFCQNIFEKLFNAGHIQFIEKETLIKHNVYGITCFDKTKQEISWFIK